MKRSLRIRIGRLADPAALLSVLESEPAGNVRLELVLPDRSRCRVARPICEHDLRRLLDAIRQGCDGWLELVFAKTTAPLCYYTRPRK